MQALATLFSIDRDQAHTTGMLAGLFFLIIGTFWLLGSLQEPIFYHLVGSYYHPQVNIISFFFIVPLMLGYMLLLDRLNVRRVFITMLALYVVFFTASALLLAHPTIGLANTQPATNRWLGWVVFAVIKTYGSFLVTLFWSFATSVTTVAVAKRTFPFIVLCAQVGSLSSTTLVRMAASWGIPALMMCSVVGMLAAIGLLVYMRSRRAPLSARAVVSKSGLFEGLWLLLKRPYLRGVLVVSTSYLIIMAFADYQMHFLAHQAYRTVEQFAWFKGVYGQVTNLCTLLLSLGGAQWLLHLLGVPLCLLIYPLLTAGCVALIYCVPTLWPLFFAMIAMRALAFGLNNPTKEILYIPETRDVRFKVKSWVDIVGYRASFAFGSQLTAFFKGSFAVLVPAGAAISMGVLGLWVWSAVFVGREFRKVSAQ